MTGFVGAMRLIDCPTECAEDLEHIADFTLGGCEVERIGAGTDFHHFFDGYCLPTKVQVPRGLRVEKALATR